MYALIQQRQRDVEFRESANDQRQRKKKLTDHWRRFIQPIMWRCKWVEFKIKEFHNQAQMYDKKLQESCQAKQLESENLKSEELGTKALSPLTCHTQNTRLKKRKK